MHGKYKAESHRAFRAWCEGKEIDALYTFADELAGPLDLAHLDAGWDVLTCHGATALASALEKVRERHPDNVAILVVTDETEAKVSYGKRVTLWMPSAEAPMTG